MPTRAHALDSLGLVLQGGCDAAGTACPASQVLHWLYWIAGSLAIIFFFVVLLAVRLWRKNKDSDRE